MKRKILRTISYAFAFIFALCCAQPAFAHGGEPRLEISVERINPGGLIEVRGVDFDYDELVVLSLMRSQIQIPLMEVTADGEGVFTQAIALPADLPLGEYNFRAKSDHHLVASPTITVWGVAAQNQEDNAIRDQSDVQLGAVPTLAPGVSSTQIPQATSTKKPVFNWKLIILTGGVLMGIGIFFVLSIRRKSFR